MKNQNATNEGGAEIQWDFLSISVYTFFLWGLYKLVQALKVDQLQA
jgi:hypothetical protein